MFSFSSGFYSLSVILLTSLWNIPRFLELQTCYTLNNTQVSFCEVRNQNDCLMDICATELRQNLQYCRDYILVGNFLVMVFLPLFLLSILNGKLYHVLAQSSKRNIGQSTKSRHKRDQGIASILITIVIVFGCCNIPRVSLNLFEVRTSSIISITYMALLSPSLFQFSLFYRCIISQLKEPLVTGISGMKNCIML